MASNRHVWTWLPILSAAVCVFLLVVWVVQAFSDKAFSFGPPMDHRFDQHHATFTLLSADSELQIQRFDPSGATEPAPAGVSGYSISYDKQGSFAGIQYKHGSCSTILEEPEKLLGLYQQFIFPYWLLVSIFALPPLIWLTKRSLTRLRDWWQTPAALNAFPIIDRAGRYRVVGVDRASKEDKVFHCDALSAANAKVKAELEGIIVTEVTFESASPERNDSTFSLPAR